MGDLIKINMLTYAFLAVFTILILSLVICTIFKKTKDIESKKIKIVLRFGVNGALICFWIWFFIYTNLFPISLAYYEYNHNFTNEKIGIIESIEQNSKDRINITIDRTKYTIVHSSVNPAVIIGRNIDEGDTVKITFGARSNYIFDIYEDMGRIE